ncbi:MAG: hypothetical protein K9H64_23730 [Bacteroidales bacterium]|nr:hypothetical protein [Bacteroidales bacterium]MCF8459058.1 hypothetical protein [Bacteroidales bacterium]
MTEWKEYNKLEIPGKMLIPGFSIYLLQINYLNEVYFYIGMTGDPFYPSARAAFHRISGHLELSDISTQNQLMASLRDRNLYESNLDDISITMHHFPINGFEKWTLTSGMKPVEIKEHIKSKDYKNYKKRQAEVENLECVLIYNLKEKIGDKLLNKTNGKKGKFSYEFIHLVMELNEIISANLIKININE